MLAGPGPAPVLVPTSLALTHPRVCLRHNEEHCVCICLSPAERVDEEWKPEERITHNRADVIKAQAPSDDKSSCCWPGSWHTSSALLGIITVDPGSHPVKWSGNAALGFHRWEKWSRRGNLAKITQLWRRERSWAPALQAHDGSCALEHLGSETNRTSILCAVTVNSLPLCIKTLKNAQVL